MPHKPLRPCKVAGCPNLTSDKYCEAHAYMADEDRKKRDAVYKRKRQDRNEQLFYTSTSWRKVRELKLARDPLCEECLKNGETTPATEVHHIREIKNGGARLLLDNLMSLCKSCHSRITKKG